MSRRQLYFSIIPPSLAVLITCLGVFINMRINAAVIETELINMEDKIEILEERTENNVSEKTFLQFEKRIDERLDKIEGYLDFLVKDKMNEN